MSVDPGTTLDKDANAELTHQWDWSAWLGDAEISTSTFTITGPDSALTKDNESIVTGNQKTQARLKAGTVGKRYKVTNQIVTNETPAQTDERSIFLQIRDL